MPADLPSPWAEFPAEVDEALTEPVVLHCLGGFVMATHYGLPRPTLDLDYVEDSSAEVDLNVVMTGSGRLIEVQATAERVPFSREELDALVDLAAVGIREIGASA